MLSLIAAIEEIVASSGEPWPWSTDRFTVAVVICSVDNNNIPVRYPYRELSSTAYYTLAFSDSHKLNAM